MKDQEKQIISNALRCSRADPTVFTFKCLGCPKHFQKTFRWFERHNGSCPSCGSKLDRKELGEYLLTLAERRKAALEREE
jgi:rRNA maturation endonuclease Nob1